MSKKQDDFYFQNFIECAGYSCQAAHLLKEILSDFRPEDGREGAAYSTNRRH